MSLSINNSPRFQNLPRFDNDGPTFQNPALAAKESQVADLPAVQDPDSQFTAELQNSFKAKFANLAQNKQAFHALLKKTFGKGYNFFKAEQLRQGALNGKFNFLPKVS